MCYKENKDKNTKKTHEIISSQKSIINNAIKLNDRRNIITDAFTSRDILPRNLEEDLYQVKKQNLRKA